VGNEYQMERLIHEKEVKHEERVSNKEVARTNPNQLSKSSKITPEISIKTHKKNDPPKFS